MATEEGIIIKVESGTAWVTTTKTSACEGCAAKSSCTVLGGGKEMEVEAINDAGAQVGQKVVLHFQTSPLLKAAFLLYVIPILFLLLGAFIGDQAAPHFSIDPSTFSVIIGFIFFGISIKLVKSKGNKLARKDAYRPKVIRILKDSVNIQV
jgi:sigma-E factor negative regulatory protein RseC